MTEFKNAKFIITSAVAPDLGRKILKHLGVKECNVVLGKFSGGETQVEVREKVKNCEIFIISAGCPSKGNSINDNFMEVVFLTDACKRSGAKSISVIYSIYPYARQDKVGTDKEGNDKIEPVSASVIADILQHIGVSRVICLHLHSEQVQGMFRGMGVDKLYIKDLVANYILQIIGNNDKSKYVIVPPDGGATKYNVSVKERVKGVGIAQIDKERDKASSVSGMTLVGDVRDKECAFILDDMTDTGGTLDKAGRLLLDNGVKSVVAIVTHGILSGPAIDILNSPTSSISMLVCTNSVPQEEHMENCKKIKLIDISEILANAIRELLV